MCQLKCPRMIKVVKPSEALCKGQRRTNDFIWRGVARGGGAGTHVVVVVLFVDKGMQEFPD